MYLGGSTGPILPGGELLLNLGSVKLSSSLLPATGSADVHSILLPADSSFAGFTYTAQAAILGGAGYELCNAYDYTVGF